MPYVNNAEKEKFGIKFYCSECGNDLPIAKIGHYVKLPDKDGKDRPVGVDLRKPCNQHPEAPFYHVYKTELYGKYFEEALKST